MTLYRWLDTHATGWIVCCGLAAFIYACIPVAGPGGNLAACIATDALRGNSIAQIADDCKTDLASVIVALLTTQSKEVPATAAYSEALKTKAVLMTMDGGAL